MGSYLNNQGQPIVTKAASNQYKEGWDRIFGKKAQEPETKDSAVEAKEQEEKIRSTTWNGPVVVKPMSTK